MKHYTLFVYKPNDKLRGFLLFCGAKDPYGIGQWIVFDRKIEKETAFEIFDSLVRNYPDGLNATLFSGKNKSTIVKQVGEVS
jgi:hypothetical protein